MSNVVAEVTEHYDLPLPPAIAGKSYTPQHNAWGQYLLPPPEGGMTQGYSRASTIADTLDDKYLLHEWEKRQLMLGLSRSMTLMADIDQIDTENRREGSPPFSKAQKSALNEIGDRAQVEAKARWNAEFGSAVHAWTEYLDHGLCTLRQVPDLFRDHALAYLTLLARHGYVSHPELTERTVLHPLRIAGTLDRGLTGPDGQLVLGDVKTNATLGYSYVSYAVQLAAYHGATAMMRRDGSGWESPPPWRGDYAVLIHLPSDDAAKSSLITFDLHSCYQLLNLAMQVRAARKQSDHVGRHVLPPVDDPAQAQRCQAVLELRTSGSAADVAAVWTRHHLVWDDGLTELGQWMLQLIDKQEG